MLTGLRWALVAVALTALTLAVLIVGVRLVRQRRERRRAALLVGPRRALLAVVAGDGDEDEDAGALRALPGPVWRALRPTALRLLGQVRGDARTRLVELLLAYGVADEARRDLRRRRAARRAAGAQTLGDLALTDPATVADLCAAVADRHPDVRAAAARALGHVGAVAAVEPLLGTLTGVARVPTLLVADALAALEPAAEQPLVTAVAHPDPLVRMTVLAAVRVRRAVAAVPAAARVLDSDPEPAVRRAAARTLGALGGRAAVPPLLAASVDGPLDLRTAAITALGEVGARSAIPVLVELLGADRYEVAHASAAVLARLPPDGLVALRQAAGSGRPGHDHAAESLALAQVRAGR